MSTNLAFSSYVSSSMLFSPISIYDPVGEAGVGIVDIVEEQGGGGNDPVPIYRGISGGSYVYSVGNPPGGATFITIIGYQ
jgi:hypothetical protein